MLVVYIELMESSSAELACISTEDRDAAATKKSPAPTSRSTSVSYGTMEADPLLPSCLLSETSGSKAEPGRCDAHCHSTQQNGGRPSPHRDENASLLQNEVLFVASPQVVLESSSTSGVAQRGGTKYALFEMGFFVCYVTVNAVTISFFETTLEPHLRPVSWFRVLYFQQAQKENYLSQILNIFSKSHYFIKKISQSE